MTIVTQIYEPNRIGVLCKLVDLLLDVLLGKVLPVNGSNNVIVALFALASAFCTLCMAVLCVGRCRTWNRNGRLGLSCMFFRRI
jgi:hypothetical protein